MKRIVLTLGLLAAVNCAAMADGNAFTPLNFNDTQYGSTTTTTTSTKSAPAASSAEGDAVGNGNIQNAILKLVKTERKALKKQVSTIEKRIKEIDKAKEKIRKNML